MQIIFMSIRSGSESITEKFLIAPSLLFTSSYNNYFSLFEFEAGEIEVLTFLYSLSSADRWKSKLISELRNALLNWNREGNSLKIERENSCSNALLYSNKSEKVLLVFVWEQNFLKIEQILLLTSIFLVFFLNPFLKTKQKQWSPCFSPHQRQNLFATAHARTHKSRKISFVRDFSLSENSSQFPTPFFRQELLRSASA